MTKLSLTSQLLSSQLATSPLYLWGCKMRKSSLIEAVDKECAIANNKLIEAAPEMFEVLEGIEKWQNGEDNEFHTIALELLRKLRA